MQFYGGNLQEKKKTIIKILFRVVVQLKNNSNLYKSVKKKVWEILHDATKLSFATKNFDKGGKKNKA